MTVDFGGVVLLDHSDAMSTVTLNRPDRLNALDAEITARLLEALQAADLEPSTNCIVLTGAGRAFCAGGNVGNMGVSAIPTVIHSDLRFHWAVLAIEKPILAMVNGPAVGLGLTIALACDIVLVADDAVVGDTHVPLGINAGDGLVVPLLLHLGPQKTKELLIRGKLITGSRAQMGAVNYSYPMVELRERTYKLAKEDASMPRYATRATKLVVNRHIRSVIDELIECSMAYETNANVAARARRGNPGLSRGKVARLLPARE